MLKRLAFPFCGWYMALMNAPFQAIVMPAPGGVQYRKSILVDADTNLPIMLPVTPELEKVGEMAAASGAAFRRACCGREA